MISGDILNQKIEAYKFSMNGADCLKIFVICFQQKSIWLCIHCVSRSSQDNLNRRFLSEIMRQVLNLMCFETGYNHTGQKGSPVIDIFFKEQYTFLTSYHLELELSENTIP